MGRDLFNRAYGRFYHLPRLLAGAGHEISILLCSYKNEPDQNDFYDENGIHWYSVSLAKLKLFRYYYKARQLAAETRPDWIIGFSDTYYGIIAHHLARSLDCKSLIDAYDNYESYIPWCKPLHHLWRRSLAKADVVTAAGPSLAELVGKTRKDKSIEVVPMAADPIGFVPMDTIECRKKLGLPVDKKLIGYCGAIYHNRGIKVLFTAFEKLLLDNNNFELVLSGRIGPGVSIPNHVRWLGYLPDNQLGFLLNSMNVLTVINKSSAFGEFSYPVKLYEAMCCKIPVVATSTKATKWILKEFPELLVKPDNSNDLANKILSALQYDRIDYGKQQGWNQEGMLFEKALSNKKMRLY